MHGWLLGADQFVSWCPPWQGFDSALYQFKPRDLLLVFAESHQTFQRLLHDTEPMIGELAGIERFMTSRSQQSETFRDWQVHEDPLNTRFMDLVDSYVLPFDHVQVNKAMRRLYSENNTTNCDKHFTEVNYLFTWLIPISSSKFERGLSSNSYCILSTSRARMTVGYAARSSTHIATTSAVAMCATARPCATLTTPHSRSFWPSRSSSQSQQVASRSARSRSVSRSGRSCGMTLQ